MLMTKSTNLSPLCQKKRNRSTLYSFDRPFQLIHGDVGNLEFLGKNAIVPKYVLLLVDFFPRRFMFTPCVAEN